MIKKEPEFCGRVEDDFAQKSRLQCAWNFAKGLRKASGLLDGTFDSSLLQTLGSLDVGYYFLRGRKILLENRTKIKLCSPFPTRASPSSFELIKQVYQIRTPLLMLIFLASNLHSPWRPLIDSTESWLFTERFFRNVARILQSSRGWKPSRLPSIFHAAEHPLKGCVEHKGPMYRIKSKKDDSAPFKSFIRC